MKEKLKLINKWQGKYSQLIEDETVKVLWFPLVEVSNDRWIGLSSEGEWVVQGFKEEIAFISHNNLIPLLPCLEHNRSLFMSSLTKGLSEYNIEENINNIFPVKKLIVCGLSGNSDYWATLALQWLEDLDIDDEIKKSLIQVLSSKWASQKLKHRIQKIIKTLKS